MYTIFTILYNSIYITIFCGMSCNKVTTHRLQNQLLPPFTVYSAGQVAISRSLAPRNIHSFLLCINFLLAYIGSL